MSENEIKRRNFVVSMGAVVASVTLAPVYGSTVGEKKMYGLIGKMNTQPGQRDAMIAILLEGVANMPGCLSYVIAKDPTDENGIWITEVWEDKASHEASLSLPAIKEAVAKGRPLIAGFGERYITEPVGGHGIRS